MVVETHKRKLSKQPSSSSFQPILHSSSLISLSDGSRSAFLPYKPSAVTVLTNLQRGNTKTNTPDCCDGDLSFFQLAAKGDLSLQHIQYEEDLDFFDQEEGGLTALMWASAYGQSHTVEDLLDAGARADLHNSNGHTALHFASKAGYPEVAKTLLSCGADINCVDERGNTPLMLATRENHPLTVSFLLVNGANLAYANADGHTAYKISILGRHAEAQQILENHMRQLLTGELTMSTNTDFK